MNWTSAADFFAMGGYAGYVWGSFGVALAALVAEAVVVRHRREAVVAHLKRRLFAARLDQERT